MPFEQLPRSPPCSFSSACAARPSPRASHPKHSPDASPRPPFYAGRAKAHLPCVKLAVYRIGGFEAGAQPLDLKPITLRRQTDRDTYLCQFVNDENRAFRDFFTKPEEHPTLGFPTTGFGASQDADNKWVHSVRGMSRSLTSVYDFVVVGQQEE